MSHTKLILVKASLTLKITGVTVLRRIWDAKGKAALISLGILVYTAFLQGHLALWQRRHAAHSGIALLLSNMDQLHFCSQKLSQTILDMLKEEYLSKKAVFLLLIVGKCQSDCLLPNQWLHFVLVQFHEYSMGLRWIHRSYHSQIEKTGVGWQVHMLDMLYTRSANRTRLERKNMSKLVYFIV